MRVMRVERLFLVLIGAALAGNCGWSAENAVLSDTKPLTMQGDLSEQMVAGIQQFLLRQIDESITNRVRLRQRIGAVDSRLAVRELEMVQGTETPGLVAGTDQFTVSSVRWPVF